MKRLILFIALIGTFSSQNIQAQHKVYVNGDLLAIELVQQLEIHYKVRVLDGRYWYDKTTGWWGMEGQAVAGLMHAKLGLGGQLKTDASNGHTGIYINGRQINAAEKRHLQAIVGQPLQLGYFWMDVWGNVGRYGGYALLNLYQLANRSGSIYNKSFSTDIGYGSNGKDFYIMGDGFSYTSF